MHAKHGTNLIKPQQKIRTKEINTENITNNCNCHVEKTCPLDEKCQISSTIYQATVTHDNNKGKSCIGLIDKAFKTQYNAHTNSFRSTKIQECNSLTQLHLDTKRQRKISYSIEWRNMGRRRAYQPS